MLGREDAMLFGLAALVVFWVVSAIRKTERRKVLFYSCCILYLAAVVSLTLFPMPLGGTGYPIRNNLVPFRTIRRALLNGFTATAQIQILGNIALSVPYGVAVRILGKGGRWLQKMLLAFMFPAVVEGTQLLLGLIIGGYRSFDVDDFILNMLGAFLGYLVYRILPRRTKEYFSDIAQKEKPA